jgi:4-amino-4-deoxy-L-arabinose transferase-like glycosyltransferase
MPQMGDGPAYVEQARSVLSGTIDHFYFPPGTAFFTLPVFSLAGFSVFSEHLAGFLIGALFLVSTVFLAQTILESSRAVFIATIIAAVYPHMLLSTAQISSLPLTASFVSLAIASAVRARRHDSTEWWVACGLACGAAVLVRPGTLLLPVVIVAMTWLSTQENERVQRRMFRPFLIVGVILATFCLPVGLFHASRGHGMTLATNSEWNVLLANNAHTPDYKTGHFGQRAIADLDTSAQAYIRQFFTAETAESATVAQRRMMLDSAQAYMLENPLRTLWRMSNRVRGSSFSAIQTRYLPL